MTTGEEGLIQTPSFASEGRRHRGKLKVLPCSYSATAKSPSKRLNRRYPGHIPDFSKGGTGSFPNRPAAYETGDLVLFVQHAPRSNPV